MSKKFVLNFISTLLGIAILALGVVYTASASPQAARLAATLAGTAFTYQGSLKDNGLPANGTYSMVFNLYDEPTGGILLGTVSDGAVSVTNGLFTIKLDFGSEVFNGQACWLELVVETETLTPRQELTPAPMALALPGLRTRQNATSPNIIGGAGTNDIAAGVVGAVIAGGAGNTIATGADYSFAAGQNNTATLPNSIALGYGAATNRPGQMAFSSTGTGQATLTTFSHTVIAADNNTHVLNIPVPDGVYAAMDIRMVGIASSGNAVMVHSSVLAKNTGGCPEFWEFSKTIDGLENGWSPNYSVYNDCANMVIDFNNNDFEAQVDWAISIETVELQVP